MKQLTIKDILDKILFLQKYDCKDMTIEEFLDIPVYLGDDDELNGVHCGWYIETIDENDKEDYIPEMIKDNDLPFSGKGILIS